MTIGFVIVSSDVYFRSSFGESVPHRPNCNIVTDDTLLLVIISIIVSIKCPLALLLSEAKQSELWMGCILLRSDAVQRE